MIGPPFRRQCVFWKWEGPAVVAIRAGRGKTGRGIFAMPGPPLAAARQICPRWCARGRMNGLSGGSTPAW